MATLPSKYNYLLNLLRFPQLQSIDLFLWCNLFSISRGNGTGGESIYGAKFAGNYPLTLVIIIIDLMYDGYCVLLTILFAYTS